MNYIIGHLVGDVLFQNKWLATIKRQHIWGMCLHCFIVTTFVFLFTSWNLLQLSLAFASHFIIDWFQFKKLWPKFIDQYEGVGPTDDQIFHILSLYLINLL